MTHTRNAWRRGATHVAIAQYIYNQQRHDPKQQPLMNTTNAINTIPMHGSSSYNNGNHAMNGNKMSGIDPTLESKIFKEHAASYTKSPPNSHVHHPHHQHHHHQQQQQHQQHQQQQARSNNNSRPIQQMTNFPPPKFPPPPPPFSPNQKVRRKFLTFSHYF